MDYSTAIKDISKMSPREMADYFQDESLAQPKPDDDKYFGTDQPQAEPGEAKGAPSPYQGAPSSSKAWTADTFQNELGLGSREGIGDNYNAGAGATDSDKTKSNPLLGKGYMSDDDFERLKDDKNFRDLYMEKASSWEGSKADRIKDGDFDWDEMSINHMDAFLDRFGSPKTENSTAEKPAYKKSDKLAQAQARNTAYGEVVVGKQGDILIGKNPDYAKDFADSYKNALRSDPDYQYRFDLKRNAKELRFDS